MAKAHIADGEVHISTGDWSDVFPVSKLDGWIAFYRKMAEHRPQNFNATLAALQEVKAGLTTTGCSRQNYCATVQ